MRYTRYNYKKNKNNNNLIMFILKLVGTVVGAGLCGIALAYVAFSVLTKNNAFPAANIGNKTSIEANNNEVVNSEEGSNEYSAFIYKDQDKFRVLSGVYESNKVDQIVSELKNSNIECAKIKFSFNNNDKVEYQISSICDGYIRLLDTAFSDDVKSINTEDFKGWTNELENISEGEKVDILNNLKEHISNLTAEINKENVPAEMEYIYTVLLNFKDI